DPSGRQLGEGGVERRQLGGAHRHLVGEAQTLVGEPGRDTADEEAGDRHREGGGGRPGRRHGGHRFGGGGRERHRPAADRHPGRRRDGAGHHGAVGAQLAVRRRGAALHDHRAAVTAPGALGGGSGGGLVGGDDVGGGDPARGARGAAAPGLGGNGGRRRILGSDQRRVAVVLRGRPEERPRQRTGGAAGGLGHRLVERDRRRRPVGASGRFGRHPADDPDRGGHGAGVDDRHLGPDPGADRSGEQGEGRHRTGDGHGDASPHPSPPER